MFTASHITPILHRHSNLLFLCHLFARNKRNRKNKTYNITLIKKIHYPHHYESLIWFCLTLTTSCCSVWRLYNDSWDFSFPSHRHWSIELIWQINKCGKCYIWNDVCSAWGAMILYVTIFHWVWGRYTFIFSSGTEEYRKYMKLLKRISCYFDHVGSLIVWTSWIVFVLYTVCTCSRKLSFQTLTFKL